MSDRVSPDTAPQPGAPSTSPRTGKRPSTALRLVALSVGLVAVIMLVLAGVPGVGVTPMPRVKSVAPRDLFELTRSEELSSGFAELCQPVDPTTGQRPDYPTTAELASRLEAMTGWETAALFALDATPAELHAAGVEDPDVCMAMNPAPRAEALPMLRHWKLVLLDDQQRLIGTTLFEVPTLDVEHFAAGEDGAGPAPVLERRFPDWPRAMVFRHLDSGAQSDG